jgi:hypothetical protein
MMPTVDQMLQPLVRVATLYRPVKHEPDVRVHRALLRVPVLCLTTCDRDPHRDQPPQLGQVIGRLAIQTRQLQQLGLAIVGLAIETA